MYDDPAAGTGVTVRDFHRDIKGVQPDGVRYHALNPTTFWWAHATFQVMVEQTIDRYSRYRLSGAEREQLYQEGVEWYRRYAMSEQPLPRIGPPSNRSGIATATRYSPPTRPPTI